jgi:hypothetical protein
MGLLSKILENMSEHGEESEWDEPSVEKRRTVSLEIWVGVV